MALVIKSQPVPLQADVDGVLRVEGSRVTLDTVVSCFDEGATAEEVVHQYPTLRLGDVYAVIAFILRNREAVDAYLTERAHEAHRVRAEVEQRCPSAGIRDRLLARRHAAGPSA